MEAIATDEGFFQDETVANEIIFINESNLESSTTIWSDQDKIRYEIVGLFFLKDQRITWSNVLRFVAQLKQLL